MAAQKATGGIDQNTIQDFVTETCIEERSSLVDMRLIFRCSNGQMTFGTCAWRAPGDSVTHYILADPGMLLQLVL